MGQVTHRCMSYGAKNRNNDVTSKPPIVLDCARMSNVSSSPIPGMLSKSKGQVLRVAAVLHVLFHMDSPLDIPTNISESAVKAADCFVDLCLQHAAYLGGRGNFQEAIDELQLGWMCALVHYVNCYEYTYLLQLVHPSALVQGRRTVHWQLTASYLERCYTSVLFW